MTRRLTLCATFLTTVCGCRVDGKSDAVAEDLRDDLGGIESKPPAYYEPEFIAKRTVRIGPEDVQPIREVEATFTKRAFEARKPGEPRVLFEAKHLRLGFAEPVSKNRGIVEVVADGSRDADALEAHLIDFERGPIAQMVAVYGGVYPKFGVARADAIIDGKEQEVLLHASDGMMLAWRQGPIAGADLYINPGLGDAWVFVNDGDGETNTHYSHWTDLRKPPPPPTRELPFYFERDEDEEGADQVEGPAVNHPDAIPAMIVRGGDPGDCPKALLHDDGTFGCVPASYRVMADGWRYDPRVDQDASLINVLTGDIVVLEDVIPNCDAPSYITPDPPRAYYPLCSDERGVDFIWSPEEVVRTTQREPSNQILAWSKNHHVLTFGMIPLLDTEPSPVMWLDMAAQQLLRSGPVYNLTPERYDRYVFYVDERDRRRLFLLAMDSGKTDLVNAKGCSDYKALGFAEPFFSFACVGHHRAIHWVGVIDTKLEISWRLPPLSEVWLQPEPPLVVGIQEVKGRTRLVAWSLGSSP